MFAGGSESGANIDVSPTPVESKVRRGAGDAGRGAGAVPCAPAVSSGLKTADVAVNAAESRRMNRPAASSREAMKSMGAEMLKNTAVQAGI